MNKKRIMILLVCIIFTVSSLVYFLKYRENIFLENEKGLADGSEVSNFIDGTDDSEVEKNTLKEENDLTQRGETANFFNPQVYFYKDDEYNIIPEELIHYLTDALKEERLIEEIERIQANYRVVSKEEKETFELDLPEEERGLGIALYYPAIKEDTWYCVSLTEEEDDIIVEHVGEDGCIVNYFFWNIMQWHKYTDVPMRAGGQRNSTPYFVTWENVNYMTIPYWDIKGEEIDGVTIYKYFNNMSGEVIAIGRNSDGTIEVIPQCCYVSFNDYIEGATIWPVVVSY